MLTDNDPFVCSWLRELCSREELTGPVIEKPIQDIGGDDLVYPQCHFFAGIGGWSLALQLAGWPADREVWTGSCPCQPFSAAGKRRGTADERHLWPEFRRLIAECRPATIFGEQVASKDGREWFARVRADLEELGYAVGAADLCAASVGAPHIRQRLFWVADAYGKRQDGQHPLLRSTAANLPEAAGSGATGGLADADKRIGGQGCSLGSQRDHRGDAEQGAGLGCGSGPERLGDAASEQMGRARQSWQDSVWLPCLDGKARRIEPGTYPLAHGVPARVGRLRGYGNAIVPQVAAEFVSAFLDAAV